MDKKLPATYEGANKAPAIITYLLKEIKKIALDRLGEIEDFKTQADSHVSLLSDDSFKDIENAKTAYVVHFYAPWSAKSFQLHTEFNKLAGSYVGKIKFAKVDAITNSKEASKLQIEKFPTIVYFKGGKSTVYNGEIDSAAIKKFIDAQVDSHKTDL